MDLDVNWLDETRNWMFIHFGRKRVTQEKRETGESTRVHVVCVASRRKCRARVKRVQYNNNTVLRTLSENVYAQAVLSVLLKSSREASAMDQQPSSRRNFILKFYYALKMTPRITSDIRQ